MSRRVLGIVVALSGAVLLPSCGDDAGPELYSVQGKVLYKGEPAAGAVVTFQWQGPHNPLPNAIPSGVADERGEFRLSCMNFGDGAPAGKYGVLIQWPEANLPALEATPAPSGVPANGPNAVAKTKTRLKRKTELNRGPQDRLRGRYSHPDNPVFTVEVKPEDNRIAPFELTD
jgi:hypothetical protein